MNQAHFQSQMGRMSERWKGVYVPSLVALIWREVKDFSDPWFTKCVDDLIGNCRQAPLMPDFRERISLERERGWTKEKAQHAQDAKDFFALNNLPTEEMRIVCQYIVKRLQGQVTDLDWESFMKGLVHMGRTS